MTIVTPATRTVRVIDRSTWGTSAPYPLIRAVTVAWICPICGGPRGEPQDFPFYENDQALSCDRWQNPCGHVDLYPALLEEAETNIITPECPDCRVPAVETGIAMYHCPKCGRDVSPVPVTPTTQPSRRGRSARLHRGQVITLAVATTDGKRSTPAKFEITTCNAQEITLRAADGRIINIII
jgi:hypothetical protein